MATASADFDALVHHVTSSYAGYEDKSTGRLDLLKDLTATVRTRFLAVASTEERTALLREWLAFFNDQHMGLISRNEPHADRALAPDDRRGGLQIRELNPETMLIRVPTFHPSLAEPLDQLLATHRDDLRSHLYLILDLRGNGGGDDTVFHGLVPLLYTRPIKLVGVDYRASAENAEHIRSLSHRRDLPDEARTHLRSIVKLMEASPDSMVPGVPDQIIELPEVLPRPERIAILIDHACVSSTEQFLLLAKQSDKVILLGQRTRGCLDYSNLRQIELPSGQHVLRLPTSRSRRLPDQGIDGRGIEPDVWISEAEVDPVAVACATLVRSRRS